MCLNGRDEKGRLCCESPFGSDELRVSEVQMQRHLNLARAADGVFGDA